MKIMSYELMLYRMIINIENKGKLLNKSMSFHLIYIYYINLVYYYYFI